MYSQVQKQKARKESLTSAVRLLTTERSNAPVVPETYVKKAYEYIMKYEEYYKEIFSYCDKDHIKLWENFHQSFVSEKSPDELKIAYLCGPEPLNDLEIFIELGINPYNIWAFENEASCYNQALKSLRINNSPFLKVYDGSIQEFFESVPKKFDLIYIDACGPLPSTESKTLSIITSLFRNNRLESPGVLLTNYALPDIKNEKIRNSYLYLIGEYLHNKEFLESIHKETQEPLAIEGANCQGLHYVEQFTNLIDKDFENYYGQYITRLIFDLSSLYVPWMRLCNSQKLWGKLFNISPDELSKKYKEMQDSAKDIISLVDNFTLFNMQSPFIAITNPPEEIKKIPQSLVHQINSNSGYKFDFINSMTCFNVLRSEGYTPQKEYYSEAFFNTMVLFYKMFSFCDSANPTLGFYPIIGQYSYPMHYNTSQCRRWSYKAKETQMFMDMFVLDECRYLYEWIPTLDLMQDSLKNLSQQLILRLIIDGIFKHKIWYNDEYFHGASVIEGYGEEPLFNVKYLPSRQYIY